MSVQSLLSYALTVPDLKAGHKFYSTFGLLPAERDGALVFRCEGRDQDQVFLVEGKKKRLNHIRFGSDEQGLAAIRARMKERGIAEIDAPHNAFGGGLWVQDPDGHPINVRAESAKPWRHATPFVINTPGHYHRQGRGAPKRHDVRPHRLGHVLLHTADLEKMTDFYIKVLGMKLTDRVPGIIAFLHLPGGGDHHVVALLADDRPGFHHASFEVASPDEIGIGAKAVMEAGYQSGWGFGRHVLGSNFFHYLRDPWMSMAEYFCDIDQIPADGSWRPEDHPPEDSLYLWGPEPGIFGANFEPE
ncbi:MAG: VOC family protein [Stellaceae bacterium]|jgi:catechol 2,3-dioxygenase-like lactoylglutathione lyase family enzyme